MFAILNNLDITKKFSIVNISVILFYFIPISLITGPFLPDLSISLIDCFIFFTEKRNNHRHKKINLFNYFSFFVFILL